MKTARITLTAIVALVLAAGTIIERLHPQVHIYTQWWFIALLALTALAAGIAIVQGKMWHRPSLLLTHASVIVILLGGALTTWTGQHGSITLKPGVSNAVFESEKGQTSTLPFSLQLESFEVVPYPGTHTPMDFVSHLIVEGQTYDISMNNILRHRGYRFYQEDYDDEGNSTLSVAHDPWGIAVTYLGYGMLLLGLLGLIVSPRGRFRQLLKGAAVISLLLLPATASAKQRQPQTLSRETAEHMGRMMVLYKGRVCPLQTYAKDFTTKLTGNATYCGLTAEQVLSGYLFYYDQWADEPAIKVKKELNASKRISIQQMQFLDTTRISPTTKKSLREASERYNLVKGILSGRSLKLFPVADSTGNIGWYGQNDKLPMNVTDGEYLFIRRWQSYCQELIMTSTEADLCKVFDKTAEYQRKSGVAMPSSTQVRAEHLYNALTTGRWLAMASITLGLLAFAYALASEGRRQRKAKWVHVASIVWVAALTAFLLLILVLRWIVGGHAPMAGGFDSMNLMAIAIGILGLLLMRRHSIALPAAMMTMGFCLLVAMMSGSNPPVTNLMPVLNSPLLTIHVAVIMCSYALLFFVMMGGVAGLVTNNENYRRLNLILLYPAVTLLASGIIIGAVWANISWGNYWSWDPKEVWALITLIVYALPLHPGILRSHRAFHIYCILAFLSVVVTFFGVNLILGGMHAYN